MIAGTLAAISPSYMVGAQAFLMENNYDPNYGMNNYDDKQSYGKDNNYDKLKENSISDSASPNEDEVKEE
jgi:hypothetical protein